MAQHKLDSLFPVNSSRRRWLKSAAALTVAAAGGILWREELSAFASDAEFFLKGPPVPDIKPEQLSRHVWMIYAKDGFPTPENRGMMSNITFAVTQKGVVILDGGGSVQIGEMAIRMIRTVTDKPVVALFASHYHGDHYLAAQAYFEAFGEIPFYAHPVTKEAIEKTGNVSSLLGSGKTPSRLLKRVLTRRRPRLWCSKTRVWPAKRKRRPGGRTTSVSTLAWPSSKPRSWRSQANFNCQK